MLAGARLVITLLLLCSSVSLTYLYNYPFFHGCGFPHPHSSKTSLWDRFRPYNKLQHGAAPFRLLALGDPQLEGDTSLPESADGYFSSLRKLRESIAGDGSIAEKLRFLSNFGYATILEDLQLLFATWRKRLDLLGNDYYLAHIYRTMHRHTNPTHVAVLGDLVGSQWIDDEEFDWRGHRFWTRVFRHGTRVEEATMAAPSVETLGADERWDKRIISIVGNHDIGYAGDVDAEKVARFERTYGRLNWEIRFQLPVDATTTTTTDTTDTTPTPSPPELRLVVLNSMNLDTPAQDPALQTATYAFVNHVIGRSRPVERRDTGTILLTHIPLHKEAGTCVDGPHFDFYPPGDGGALREQNMISYAAGKGVLEGIYGMSANPDAPGRGLGRNGVILTGHDHEGCDVYHYLPKQENEEEKEEGGERGGGWEDRRWNATRWAEAADVRVQADIPGLREITVRSMMGDFGGNAGLLSAWFDEGVGEWRFEYATCAVGVQHIWWAVHGLALVALGAASLVGLGRWL